MGGWGYFAMQSDKPCWSVRVSPCVIINMCHMKNYFFSCDFCLDAGSGPRAKTLHWFICLENAGNFGCPHSPSPPPPPPPTHTHTHIKHIVGGRGIGDKINNLKQARLWSWKLIFTDLHVNMREPRPLSKKNLIHPCSWSLLCHTLTWCLSGSLCVTYHLMSPWFPLCHTLTWCLWFPLCHIPLNVSLVPSVPHTT